MKHIKQPKKRVPSHKATARKQRPLHRRVTLHPLTLLLLMCIGVLMLGSTYQAMGASTNLSLNITAPPLTSPAIITSPTDQARYSHADIDVLGTCPNDSYVKIYKNENFSGVANCGGGNFTLRITLSKGTNTLAAKVFNFSNEQGPASASITVYYDAPETPTTNTPPLPPTTPSSAPLRITTDYQYKVHPSGKPVRLELALFGGTAPYALAVDWNDGKITPIPRANTAPFIAEHTYEAKTRLHTYVIKVAVGDQNGDSDFIQLMAVVDGTEPTISSGTTESPAVTKTMNDRFEPLLIYLWPTYIIIVLMVLSFYLGEREERRILYRKNRIQHL